VLEVDIRNLVFFGVSQSLSPSDEGVARVVGARSAG
jgi:hypothetical protein